MGEYVRHDFLKTSFPTPLHGIGVGLDTFVVELAGIIG